MESDTLTSKQLHFIVERNIPYIHGALEPFGKVEYLDPESITPDTVRHADALIVRTRTRCNAKLLEGSTVKFIATATIGTDHIDMDWCHSHGITIANAPGCNAPAVAQYVLASIASLANRPVSQYRLGIVGVGNVGRIVEKWALSMGMDVMLCDPPRQRAEGGTRWHTLDQLAAACDVITFHTPLIHTGPDATYHLADEAFFNTLRRSPIIINAARGPIVDTPALTAAIKEGKVFQAVIDTWENEPHPDPELMAYTAIATPHIAGYSSEGKLRATRMALDAVSKFFGLPPISFRDDRRTPVAERVSVPRLLWSYDPLADDQALRENPEDFEALRNNYRLRHEP